MLTTLYNAVSAATDWFWGVPALVILIGGGIYLSFCTRFVQFRHFGAAMKMTIGKSFGKNARARMAAASPAGRPSVPPFPEPSAPATLWAWAPPLPWAALAPCCGWN